MQIAAIHGNKSQGARTRALAGFKCGEVRVLVATDIAARGLDIEKLPHVVNFDLPNVPENYVHRIGRTARAGASGAAISFCDQAERDYLVSIERLIKKPLKNIGNIATSHNHKPDDKRAYKTKSWKKKNSRRSGSNPVKVKNRAAKLTRVKSFVNGLSA